MEQVTLPRLGTFEAWRAHARRLARANVPGAQVEWVFEGACAGLFAQPGAVARNPMREVTVSKTFLSCARLAVNHSDPARFALAYDILMRAQARPSLLRDRTDAGVARLFEMEKSVRRDMHKMKAFVRFREVGDGAGYDTGHDSDDGTGPRRHFVSWFEPEHSIVELVSGFFIRRFADMDWVIATPLMTVSFLDGVASFDTTPRCKPDLDDPTEELWKTYFANIFNPARLKVKAMTSEMPKKYWKNMPEAALIPELIAGAEAQVRAMAQAGPSIPPTRAAVITQKLQEAQMRPAVTGGLDGLSASLERCVRCPIGGCATQAVPGQGPLGAQLMIVGEQPGDVEDLTGRAFSGPAGQLLDRALAQAGIERAAHYVTNAVKHFKFAPRGKRRIHQSPNRSEIDACRWWLDQEVELVRPSVVVALGRTALQALCGNGEGLLGRRGGVEPGLLGLPVLVTTHPSYVLRLPDDGARAAAFDALVRDLQQARGLVEAAP